MSTKSPEVGQRVVAAGIATNYHDMGSGSTVMLIHGSGPGVSAWANWRLVIPKLAEQHRVLAPDMVGFGFTDRPANQHYNMDEWVKHAVGFMDAMGIAKTHLVGNSFGGGLALALAIRHPERVERLVLMGSVGVTFEITPGLDAVWGYTPSFENMRTIMDLFAYDRNLVSDELAKLRYEASIQPGFQESYSQMFPAPRQRWVDAMASPEHAIKALPHDTLVIHGREDRIIPPGNSYTLSDWIPRSQLHIFGQCGHWTQIEHAKRFANLLNNFFTD